MQSKRISKEVGMLSSYIYTQVSLFEHDLKIYLIFLSKQKQCSKQTVLEKHQNDLCKISKRTIKDMLFTFSLHCLCIWIFSHKDNGLYIALHSVELNQQLIWFCILSAKKAVNTGILPAVWTQMASVEPCQFTAAENQGQRIKGSFPEEQGFVSMPPSSKGSELSGEYSPYWNYFLSVAVCVYTSIYNDTFVH